MKPAISPTSSNFDLESVSKHDETSKSIDHSIIFSSQEKHNSEDDDDNSDTESHGPPQTYLQNSETSSLEPVNSSKSLEPVDKNSNPDDDNLLDQNLTRILTDIGDFAAYNSITKTQTSQTKTGQTVERQRSRLSISSRRSVVQSICRSISRQTSSGQKEQNTEENENSQYENKAKYTIFSKNEVLYIAIVASCCAFFSTISVPIYLAALDTLASDFNVSIELINLTVTVYSIVQGLSPAIWGSIADSIGRRPVIISCLVVYIGANIGLALAKNYGFLVGFRILQAGGIASTITVGSGVIGDITERKTRGLYMGIFSGIAMIGNAIGPLIGGALAGTLGWRSIFWFLIIASGVTVAIVTMLLPETSRKRVGNGSIPAKSFFNKSPYMLFRRGIVQDAKNQTPDLDTLMPPSPVRLARTLELFLEKDTFIILLPNAIHYTCWFMLITAQSTLLTNQYHFTTLRLGLSYLANGGGSVLGSLISGRVMNYFYQKEVLRFQKKHGIEKATALIDARDPSFNIHRARLAPLPIVSTLQIIGSLVFGWTVQKNVHYAVPIVFTALVSFSSLFSFNLSSTLMVDLYTKEASSASAAVNLLRCLICAGGVSAVDRMNMVMGTGGTFTLMSGLMLLTWALNFFEIKNGPKFQKERIEKAKLREEKQRQKENEKVSEKELKKDEV